MYNLTFRINAKEEMSIRKRKMKKEYYNKK